MLLLIYLLLISVTAILSEETTATDDSDITEWKKNPRETNIINFVRLLVIRLIYGFATMMGFGESISEIGDGALVPPGVDDDYRAQDYDRDYADYY